MQNAETTSKEMRDAIRKAYADYSKLMEDIDTIEKARQLYIRIGRRPLPGYYDMLEAILEQRGTLASSIINQVKEYYVEYSDLKTLVKHLDGMKGPSAYVYALESLTGENFM